MPICCTCREDKAADNFYIMRSGKPTARCKLCSREYNIEWRRKNPEKARSSFIRYRENNREKYLATKQKWREENRVSSRLRALEHYRSHKKQRRAYVQQRMKTNISFRMAERLRSRVSKAIRGIQKSAHTLELLGCEVAYLLQHLESKFRPGMSWENYGPVWHVDHIRPCASFDLSDPAQQRQCFHYTNLQPLFAIENHIKGANYVSGI